MTCINPSVDEQKSHFIGAITDASLSEGWKDCLNAWEEGTADEKAIALNWIHEYRDRCLSAYNDVDDIEALYTLGAVNYIELKSHWIMMNTQVNYQNAVKGMADMNIAVRGSLVTVLLMALEAALAQEDVNKIIEFLSEPVSNYGNKEQVAA